MDRDAEIAEIKRELDILRTRHALYAKRGRILKFYFTIAMPLVAMFGAAVAIAVFGADALLATFFALMVVIVAAIIWLMMSVKFKGRGPGWIDLASPPARFTNPFTTPSDAQTIEAQITIRERRLTELGAHL